MKTIFLFGLLYAALLPASAQLSIERYVTANAGRTLSSGALSHEFTLGELAITSVSSATLQLSQGFQQGNPGPASSLLPLALAGALTIYPQPAGSALYLRLQKASSTALQVEIHDLMGRSYLHNHALFSPGETEARLDLSGWSPGTYLIRLRDAQGKAVFRGTWVKG